MDRKLHISSSVSPSSSGVGPWTAVDCVESAHLFAAGRHNDLVYVCAVDDCKVGTVVNLVVSLKFSTNDACHIKIGTY